MRGGFLEGERNFSRCLGGFKLEVGFQLVEFVEELFGYLVTEGGREFFAPFLCGKLRIFGHETAYGAESTAVPGEAAR